MGKFHDKTFPGESEGYRTTRDALLAAEKELRQRIEAVAAMRRQLPLGGPLKQDYVFAEGGRDLADQKTIKETRCSELFQEGKNTLIIYSFMYPPDAETPCPMCNAILDGINGNAQHAQDRVNLAVVAKAPIQKIRDWARGREWKNLRLLSSGDNSYNSDYFAENAEWGQIPAINVFRKTPEGIFHSYNTELLYAASEPGQEPRHADAIWPLWNLLDLSPEGRGSDWYPKYSYEN